MFELYGFIVILLSIPTWVFFLLLLSRASLCVAFWQRDRLRNVCIATTLVIAITAIPSVAVQASFRMDAKSRLDSGFGVAFKSCKVAKYRFVPAGLGDTIEYWRLKNVDSGDYMQVISRYHLTTLAANPPSHPASTRDRPLWWPRSTRGYSVFEVQDTEGGGMEVWVPQDGPCVYLWRFLE